MGWNPIRTNDNKKCGDCSWFQWSEEDGYFRCFHDFGNVTDENQFRCDDFAYNPSVKVRVEWLNEQ